MIDYQFSIITANGGFSMPFLHDTLSLKSNIIFLSFQNELSKWMCCNSNWCDYFGKSGIKKIKKKAKALV